ncbi:hypothetical protein GUJ93_ZPchr0006g42629 [Zizania palustris]|uniref:Dynamin-type G domain-containing protein n=1 Tax=Zizania palustris TaxID=103762 RepID=A0A8J5VS42_ZIZPA|nr:hypothetical protein GUJ93_ZPchr0006g42629 [Zizania palustris]
MGTTNVDAVVALVGGARRRARRDTVVVHRHAISGWHQLLRDGETPPPRPPDGPRPHRPRSPVPLLGGGREPHVLATTIADLIKQRTERHLWKIHAAVFSKAIVMRVEYAHYPNLTIIDTPGFVLKAKKGEPESTPEEILSMVKSLASPSHRLLLFLQRSSVEWCSSLWLDVIREIDPTFRHTMIVISKFDNRLKEFTEHWEVDSYLSASGYLGDNIHSCFVALPKDCGMISNEDFRRQICQLDIDVLCHLRDSVKGGFNEEKYGPYIGFSCLRKYLESELQKRYKEAAPATLALFAQFFVKPLMSQDAVLREINVIDYEHKKNLLSDGWRMYQRAEARQRSAWATVLPTAE